MCFFFYFVSFRKLSGIDVLGKYLQEEMLIIVYLLGSFTCVNCNKRYGKKNSLYKHLKYDCGQQRKFFCTFCTYRSKRKENVKKHVCEKHGVGFKNDFDAFIGMDWQLFMWKFILILDFLTSRFSCYVFVSI